jgi:hypothetical protein
VIDIIVNGKLDKNVVYAKKGKKKRKKEAENERKKREREKKEKTRVSQVEVQFKNSQVEMHRMNDKENR